MVRTPQELLEDIRTRIGEDTSDEALALIENVTDTLGDLESKVTDNTDWKKKFEENDAQWREKYKSRFFNTEVQEENPEEFEETETPMTTFEQLFELKED